MADFVPAHPGEILETEFLERLGISAYVLAKTIDVPQTRISAIIHGRRSISADTGLRLSKAFRLSDMFWLDMQARYDADMARMEHGAALACICPLR